jgi:asparagine N-glycosylation enzyme membrane subunit Stt3
MRRTSGRDDGLRMLVAVAFFTLAVAVRALPWRSVLAPDGVHLAGHDAWYHLRRIAWSIANASQVLDFDPFVHFPAGGRPIWPAAFDAALAALFGLWVPAGDGAALERGAVWVPPVLGGLGVAALTLIAWRNFGRSVALVAGLVLALLPAHFWYSRLGYVDHHVAVSLAATLALGAALALVRAAEPDARRAVVAVGAFGASLAALLVIWPGSLLHVALFEAALAVHAAGRRTPAAAVAAACRLAFAHGIAFALVLPFCLGNEWPQWGPFSPVVLSTFQPWWLGAVGIGAGLSALSWSTPAGARAASRVALAIGVGALVVGTSLAVWPDLCSAAADAMRWLLRSESFQARVAESQPLFLTRGRFDPNPAIARLSPFVFLVPVALPWIWLRAGGRADADRIRVVAVWGAGLFIATLVQRRFFHTFAVTEALLIGLCWVELERILALRLARAQRAATRVGLAALLALLLLPTVSSYLPFLVRPAPGEPFPLPPATLKRRVTETLAIWLRENTPEVDGWLELDATPAYGVMGPWEVGHAIQYLGRRPTVIDNFGDDLGTDNFERAARYFASPEPEALEILEDLRVRYVVTGPGAVIGAPPGPRSMARALAVRDGAALAGSPSVPALERHRLLWESSSLSPRDPDAAPLYKVFEVVPGARIEGQAPAGARVALDLALRTGRGRDTGYRATTVADASGRFEFRVPHAAPGGTADVRAPGAYQIRCGSRVTRLRVAEEAVARGAQVLVEGACPEDAGVRPLLEDDRGL